MTGEYCRPFKLLTCINKHKFIVYFVHTVLGLGMGVLLLSPLRVPFYKRTQKKLVSYPINNTSTTDSCVVCIKRYVIVKVTLTVIISLADMCA